jgi:replication factor C large subunit
VDLDVLPFVKQLAASDPEIRVAMVKQLGLEPEELGFILDKKPDSKDVKAVFAAIEKESEPEPPPKKTRAKASKTAPEPPSGKADPAVADPVPETPKEAPEETPKEAPKKPAAEKRKNNQASLFDF